MDNKFELIFNERVDAPELKNLPIDDNMNGIIEEEEMEDGSPYCISPEGRSSMSPRLPWAGCCPVIRAALSAPHNLDGWRRGRRLLDPDGLHVGDKVVRNWVRNCLSDPDVDPCYRFVCPARREPDGDIDLAVVLDQGGVVGR